jgi:hypothetical protein
MMRDPCVDSQDVTLPPIRLVVRRNNMRADALKAGYGTGAACKTSIQGTPHFWQACDHFSKAILPERHYFWKRFRSKEGMRGSAVMSVVARIMLKTS